jgi:hypothetical protein
MVKRKGTTSLQKCRIIVCIRQDMVMTDLLDQKLDYIFKHIFGTEEKKPLLISFLNSLLKDNPKDNPHIKDLKLENTKNK